MDAKSSVYFRLIWLQGAITIIGTTFTYWMVSSLAAKSLVYGSGVTLLSTLFLAWRFQQGARQESMDAGKILQQAYRSALERFAWVAVMLGVGFKLLELAPLWLLAGFIAGQAAWLLLPAWMKFENAK